jgi:hypothetical protein
MPTGSACCTQSVCTAAALRHTWHRWPPHVDWWIQPAVIDGDACRGATVLSGAKGIPIFSEKPPHQRPELADFWDHRFRSGATPWEAGLAPLELREFTHRYGAHGLGDDHIDGLSTPAKRPRVLVPGCGSAYDAAFLDRRGWQTTALDFSAAAIEAARSTLGDSWRGTLLCADFFFNSTLSDSTFRSSRDLRLSCGRMPYVVIVQSIHGVVNDNVNSNTSIAYLRWSLRHSSTSIRTSRPISIAFKAGPVR